MASLPHHDGLYLPGTISQHEPFLPVRCLVMAMEKKYSRQLSIMFCSSTRLCTKHRGMIVSLLSWSIYSRRNRLKVDKRTIKSYNKVIRVLWGQVIEIASTIFIGQSLKSLKKWYLSEHINSSILSSSHTSLFQHDPFLFVRLFWGSYLTYCIFLVPQKKIILTRQT